MTFNTNINNVLFMVIAGIIALIVTYIFIKLLFPVILFLIVAGLVYTGIKKYYYNNRYQY